MKRFMEAFAFWLLMLISLALLLFMAGIMLGFVPVADAP